MKSAPKHQKADSPEHSSLPPLPLGWCWTALVKLASSDANAVTDGPFGSRLKTEHYTNEGPRVIRLQNIGDGHFKNEYAHISEAHFENLQKHRVCGNDLVIAALGETLPKACLIPDWVGPAIVKADCIRFKPNLDCVLPGFLCHNLNSHDTRTRTAAIIHGVGRPRLNLGEVKSIVLPLAPLNEQRRIVAKIDELFSDLDAAVAALERVRAKLKRYRASVLKAAVEGKLTEEWRHQNPNIEPATALLDRILKERRHRWEEAQLAKFKAAGKEPPKDWKAKYQQPPGPDTSAVATLPKGWCWARVEQLGDVQLGRQRSPKHHTGNHMRPYLRVANVFENRIDTTDVMQMNFTPDEYETYKLGYGDILLNEGQSLHLVGRPAMYRDEVPDSCFTNTLVRFRAADGLLSAYALNVFLAYLHSKRFQKIARWTVNIAHLGADRFCNIEFPLPPQQEQIELVREVEDRLSIVDQIVAQVDANLKRTARLRQSILKRAFEGKLVPQDPTDEPADKLLERIGVARNGTYTIKQPRGNRHKDGAAK